MSAGFFSSAASTMLSVWLLSWGIRRQGELDHELDSTAKHLRWSMVVLGIAVAIVATAPRIDSAKCALSGWVWATAFLAWPNLAFHLTATLRCYKLLPPSESKEI